VAGSFPVGISGLFSSISSEQLFPSWIFRKMKFIVMTDGSAVNDLAGPNQHE
jgi:hypothetical protein